jgi:hypothetical protein
MAAKFTALFARKTGAAKRSPAPKTVGEMDTFITMLATACENKMVHGYLEKLLSLPDQERQAAVHAWINDLLIAQAPQDFVAAIACLMDDKVAEKAYEVIYECKR